MRSFFHYIVEKCAFDLMVETSKLVFLELTFFHKKFIGIKPTSFPDLM